MARTKDRLVKKLRRQGATTYAVANRYLETTYTAEHNRRFAIAPASPENFHLAVPRGLSLDSVFRLQEDRTISHDWVVRYDNRFLQLTRQSGYPPARSTVHVCEAADGHLEIRYRDRVMVWQEIAPRSGVVVTPRPQAAPHAATPRGPRAGADHPWRQGFKQMGRDVPLWQVVDR
jgi:hypothetical protein